MQELQETRVLSPEDPLEEETATQARVLFWRIPWAEEPDRLHFMRLQRAGRDCSDLAHTPPDKKCCRAGAHGVEGGGASEIKSLIVQVFGSPVRQPLKCLKKRRNSIRER